MKIKGESENTLKKYLSDEKIQKLDKITVLEIKQELIYRQKQNDNFINNISNSPYHDIALRYWHKKGEHEIDYLLIILAYSEFAKIDHKINKIKKEK